MKIREVIEKREERKWLRIELLMILKSILFALLLAAIIYLYLCRECGV